MSFTLGRRDGPSKDEKAYFEQGDPDRLFCDLQEIGHGSFGAVYCAVDARDGAVTQGQNVAIKKMSYAGRVSEKFGEIMKEVKLLRMIRHPNVVELIGTFLKEREYSAWIIMEYCLGSVSDCVEVQPKLLKEYEISQILRNILQGLSYLHTNMIIHRDIKAGNILLAETGIAKLADFGSASSTWPANSFVGSPYWMAPEVIMAMEDGKYDGSADIWSLGITAIEIADKKPPLFSQNAMAALYQIAQSDPPTLSRENGWTERLIDLVKSFLQKSPDDRPTAANALENPYFRDTEDKPDYIVQLIRRTKKMVEEEEDNRHKRMVRILRDLPGDSEGSLGSMQSRNDESSVNDLSDYTDSDIESQESNSNHGSLNRADQFGATDFHDKSNLVYHEEVIARPPTIRPNRTGQSQMNRYDGHSRANQTFGTAVGSGFSTIRPVTLMKKEKEEQKNHSAFREQMGNYKKLRQEHRKTMMDLEAKLEKEMENHQRNLQNELHRQRKKHEDDRVRQARKRHAHLEKLLREDEQEERLYEKALDQKEDKEKSEIDDVHRNEMKLCKQKYSNGQYNATSREQARQKLCMHHADQKSQLEREQRQAHEMELRKWKRRRLISRQNEEQKMFEEEMAEKLYRTEEENKLMKDHHEATRVLEYKHMKQIHDMRLNHQVIQHNTEIEAQKEHMRNREQELKRRHQSAQKQAPKDLKDRDQHLKKQFRDNIKVQDKQYKAFKNHVLETTPKKEQASVLKKIKIEKKRKMSLFLDQLEKARKDLHQDNNLRLQDRQKTEETELKITLENDLKLLQKLQYDRRGQVIGMNTTEESALEKKVSLRLGLLLQRQDKSRRQHADDRATRFRLLSELQSAEIQKFDTESLRLGFNTVVVDTRSGNYYLLSPPEARNSGQVNQSQDRRLMAPDEVRQAQSQHYRGPRTSHGHGPSRDPSHQSSSSNHSSSSRHRNGTSFY